MHKDPLGNDLIEGDVVAYASHNRLKIGIIHRCTPKMVLVIPAGKQYWDRKYPFDVVKIEDKKTTLYFLNK